MLVEDFLARETVGDGREASAPPAAGAVAPLPAMPSRSLAWPHHWKGH